MSSRLLSRRDVDFLLFEWLDAGSLTARPRGAGLDASAGGIQLPHVVAAACMAWFYAANVSTSAYLMLTISAANLLLAHGDAGQVDRYVRAMADGRFLGTMCLSEPQAGSLADVATRAEPQPDGLFRIFGTKMWISGGDHELSENIVHLVLGRIAGSPPGSRGLSLFIVPKWLVAAKAGTGQRHAVPGGARSRGSRLDVA